MMTNQIKLPRNLRKFSWKTSDIRTLVYTENKVPERRAAENKVAQSTEAKSRSSSSLLFFIVFCM